ncbi:hypothetical protein KIN20_007781 [Parelaphostrongylus tenuis]|uniref:Uncharacterized protein n=1 Tax=Parelaphostrongylus tenuis TaxID=148309 RepID=A0AAD5QK81_PARTN|nr:hypothetical protein KIN20_007781 [Parelaphostrongylus tenuis]
MSFIRISVVRVELTIFVQMSSRTSSKTTKKRHQKELSGGDIELSKNGLNSQDKRRKCTQDTSETLSRVNDVHGGPHEAIPKCITEFFTHAQSLCRSDPCAAFTKLVSARLVGMFDLLSEKITGLSEEQRILHYRFATDLPEMQTVLVCKIGRYCLWRDIPNGDDCLFVYVANECRFPKIELVGDNMEHVIVHLGKKVKEPVGAFLSTPVNDVEKQIKTVIAQRNKKKLGQAPNGVGLWVKVVNDIGYRPIAESPAKIKKMLELICSTSEESERQSAMQWLMEIVSYVQMADDECDFGMGLELGYWLFLANHESLDKLAHRILSTAYTLLEREEYKKILDLQMSPGVRRRKELDAGR